ncbi:MAG: tetratricopeptide repeat protein, partial [Coriobacteriia bacterium]|nr:tetratricopeptide repeat protein [Coriobacteriia bacterium]
MAEGMEFTGAFSGLTPKDENYITGIYYVAEQFLSIQRLTHYTDHTINHSLRVLKSILELLEGTKCKLNRPEKIILLGAILLHDVGMQAVAFSKLHDRETADSYDVLEDVRKNHHLYSDRIIRGQYKHSEYDELQNALRRLGGAKYITGIATVSKFHRKLKLSSKSLANTDIDGHEVRLRLLAALLRLGDCLDMDNNRVVMHSLLSSSIPKKSEFLWYCHYYVVSVSVNHQKSMVTFRFPGRYPSSSICQQEIVKFVLKGLSDQISEVVEILAGQQILLHKLVESSIRNNEVCERMDKQLERYVETRGFNNDPEKETDKLASKPISAHDSPGSATPVTSSSTRLSELPDRNPDFAGRERHLQTIKDYFAGGSANHTLTLVGTGGYGKSSIAIEYVYRNADELDCIWFINADSTISIEDSYRKFAYETGMLSALSDEEDIELVKLHVKNWQTQNSRYLFIFDNAEGTENLADYIHTGALQGHILVTTRNTNQIYGKRLTIGVFTLKDSVDFLRNNRHVKGIKVSDAQILAKMLGNLPLALEHAVAFMEKNANMSCSRYIDELKSRGLEILSVPIKSEDEAEKLVNTTWQISMEKIVSESAHALFSLCAYCASDNIPLSMFIKGSSMIASPALREDLEHNDVLKVYELIEDLAHYSLVNFTSDADGEVYMTIHQLIQDVVKASHTEHGDETWLMQCIGIALEILPDDFDSVDTRKVFGLCLPHVLAIADNAEKNTNLQDNETRLNIAGLNHGIARGLYDIGQYSAALERYGKALATKEEVLGERHPDTASIYIGLANVYYAQGDHDRALEYYGKAMAILEEVLGERHPDTAITYNNIAGVYRAQGDHDRALEYYGKATAIYEEVLGERHPDTASTYIGLANVYYAQGDH